jgi:hypothetical protein
MQLVSSYMFHGTHRHIFLLDDKLTIQTDTTHRSFLLHFCVLFWKYGLIIQFTLWFQICYVLFMTISVAARSKTWDCGGLFAGIAGSNHAGCKDISVLWVWVWVCDCVWVCVSVWVWVWVCECEYWALSGRGLCDGPIPRTWESYSVCVCVSCSGAALTLCTYSE